MAVWPTESRASDKRRCGLGQRSCSGGGRKPERGGVRAYVGPTFGSTRTLPLYPGMSSAQGTAGLQWNGPVTRYKGLRAHQACRAGVRAVLGSYAPPDPRVVVPCPIDLTPVLLARGSGGETPMRKVVRLTPVPLWAVPGDLPRRARAARAHDDLPQVSSARPSVTTPHANCRPRAARSGARCEPRHVSRHFPPNVPPLRGGCTLPEWRQNSW